MPLSPLHHMSLAGHTHLTIGQARWRLLRRNHPARVLGRTDYSTSDDIGKESPDHSNRMLEDLAVRGKGGSSPGLDRDSRMGHRTK